MPKQMYEYYAKTDKVLKMKRIFVEEKESETDSEMTDSDIEDLEHLRISKTYEEALNQFLKPGEKPPREITQDLQDSDEMEVDPNLEEPSDEANQSKADGDSGEHSLNLTAMELLQAKEEAKEQEEQLIDPDYEPGRSDWKNQMFWFIKSSPKGRKELFRIWKHFLGKQKFSSKKKKTKRFFGMFSKNTFFRFQRKTFITSFTFSNQLKNSNSKLSNFRVKSRIWAFETGRFITYNLIMNKTDEKCSKKLNWFTIIHL